MAEDPRSKKLEISLLYIESDRLTRETVSHILKRKVRNLYEAGNRRDGLELFTQYAPDIVMSNIELGDAEKFGMAREIRRINPKVPMIITSAHGQDDFIEETKRIGINCYLQKPIDVGKLLLAIMICAKLVWMERGVQDWEEELGDFFSNSERKIG